MQRLLDPVFFAFERLWQHRMLVFWTLVGLSAATTLALSLTLYVDAVNTESAHRQPERSALCVPLPLPGQLGRRHHPGGRGAGQRRDPGRVCATPSACPWRARCVLSAAATGT